MVQDLAIGTVLIAATVCLHTLGLMAVTDLTARLMPLWRAHARVGPVLAMMSVVLGIFAILSVEIWFWAGAYLLLGVVPGGEAALYFSTTTFATVGFGDVVPHAQWRLLAAL